MSELPFSSKALALFQEFSQCQSKEDRRRILIELGSQMASEHDDSDPSASDIVHEYFEEYAQAKLAFEQASLRVGRLSVTCIADFLSNHEAEEDDDVSENRPN